jgi:hypothetical protein
MDCVTCKHETTSIIQGYNVCMDCGLEVSQFVSLHEEYFYNPYITFRKSAEENRKQRFLACLYAVVPVNLMNSIYTDTVYNDFILFSSLTHLKRVRFEGFIIAYFKWRHNIELTGTEKKTRARYIVSIIKSLNAVIK